ncbi:MAG: hypothetical protein AMXMBFR4_17000 [Candidatus Hydrogenedentota bacterium]
MYNWYGYDVSLCAQRRWCNRLINEPCPEDEAMKVCQESTEPWEDMWTYVNWLGINPCPDD